MSVRIEEEFDESYRRIDLHIHVHVDPIVITTRPQPASIRLVPTAVHTNPDTKE